MRNLRWLKTAVLELLVSMMCWNTLMIKEWRIKENIEDNIGDKFSDMIGPDFWQVRYTANYVVLRTFTPVSNLAVLKNETDMQLVFYTIYPVTCHMSLVTCPLSPVTCPLSPVTCRCITTNQQHSSFYWSNDFQHFSMKLPQRLYPGTVRS